MEQVQIKHKVKRFGIWHNVFFLLLMNSLSILFVWLTSDFSFLYMPLVFLPFKLSPIVIIKDGTFTIHFINPFRKKMRVRLEDLSKVKFWVDHQYVTVIFYKSVKYRKVEMPDDTAKDIYDHFISLGINVESKGYYSTGWGP